MEQPEGIEIKNTFGLWSSSLDNAIKHGGDLTIEAIKTFDFKFDRKHIVIDTKIHMLISGFSPAILG